MRSAIVVGLILLIGTWAILAVVASRLPPGTLKEVVGFLPACVTFLRRLARDPRVPVRAKIAIVLAALWVISPIDLVPEFLPIVGPLDDVVVVALALRYAVKRVPRSVIFEAWPADPALLQRLLGHDPAIGAGSVETGEWER